ncbi:hypothetical protein HPDFL43_01800 [Hoeflea phototrophica DFL-43]|jgi:hypothetical protein|uniref:Uncharacterized protein n=1 Tax=Hoeflea phototrophica (strain DSM 17068 / NCIMB 14078 / DFL-43) TaxID=411684 RepID=A9D001_HOEPD|nr:hypothetical protein HPDFL43_01800 [Hoeflea phototrophica DFL-43]
MDNANRRVSKKLGAIQIDNAVIERIVEIHSAMNSFLRFGSHALTLEQRDRETPV